jgi:tetratricopeptide (TPR) repeat protein
MRVRWIPVAIPLAAAIQLAAAAVTDADRTKVYQSFRTQFDARHYQEALPIAERLVTLTEEQYGADNRALVNPLTNLGTTQYRLRDYPAAEKSYLRGVEILEATAGNGDRQLLRPLHGLGATYLAAGQYEDGSVALKRAIDLSRNLDGLFNIEQLEILEPLIACYVALDAKAEAEKEHQYALRVAESAFGRTDGRMLGPLDRYARWLERIGRYTTARLLYARALSIAEKSMGRGSVATVSPLQGIARSYRLEFLNGPEEEGQDSEPFGSNSGMADSSNVLRLNPDGERALRMALQTLDRNPPVDHRRRGETLIELGDWFTSGGAFTKGVEQYREAWKELTQGGSTALLESPRLIAYRPPPSSVLRSSLTDENSEEHLVEVKLTVTPEGRTADVEASTSDAPEAMQKSVQAAAKKARYSPRFENGEPVATPGVTLRERVLVRVKKSAES